MFLKNLPPLSRRDFLKSTSLAGLAATTPAWLTGCGGDNDHNDTPEPPAAGRELRDLHFDFSNRPEVTDIRLMALRSPADQRILLPHSNETRDQFRLENPLLASIDDARLTHYIEDVDLPADALQTIMSFGTQMDTGDTVLCSAQIHIPKASLNAFAKRALAFGAEPVNQSLFGQYQARQASSVKALTEALTDINDLSTWDDIAAFLVFHHPEIMNLNADLGCDILQRIYSLPCADGDTGCFTNLSALSRDLEDAGCASTTPGGWATLVQATRQTFDENGNLGPAVPLESDGKPVYRYDIDPDIVERIGDVVQVILKNIFDDTLFEGTNWKATQGLGSIDQSAANLGAPIGGEGPLRIAPEHSAGTTLYGVEMLSFEVKQGAEREIEVALKNRFLRYLNAHVEYRDINDKPLNIKTLFSEQNELDTATARYLRLLSTNDTIAGIPLDPEEIELTLPMPEQASSAMLRFTGLGINAPIPNEAMSPIILTSIVNIGIPALLLALGIGAGASAAHAVITEAAEAVIKSAEEFALVLQALEDLYEILGGVVAGGGGELLIAVGNVAINLFLELFPEALAKLAAIAAADKLAAAVPYVGIAMTVLSAIATAAALAQTIVETLTSPPLFTNRLSLVQDIKLQLKPTPAGSSFATAASHYKITAHYNQSITRTLEGTVLGGSTNPIALEWKDSPIGGTVEFTVTLMSADGCLVGQGSSGELDNQPEQVSELEIDIKQVALPLTANTQYQHRYKLAMVSGKRNWQQTNTPPTAVQGNLSASGLSALNDVSVQTYTSMLGYSFRAAGQNISACDGGASDPLHVVQNISLATDGSGDQGLQFSGCGFREPSAVVYTAQGTQEKPGKNFFIRPKDSYFHVLSMVPGKGAIDPAQTVSWGRFTLAPTSLALHPQGFVVGVSREKHKMEILQLPEQAVPFSDAQDAVPFAVMKSGLGGRPGLLDTPVAVAVYQGTILVLERGSNGRGFRRIQAFDISANPVKQFRNKSTNILPLPEDGSEYLDLGVDGLGYIFLLNVVNGGGSPNDYRLDVYDPEGNFITRTSGMAAGRLAVGLFRTVHTLNFETLTGSTRTEPTVSQWVPVTPGGCG